MGASLLLQFNCKNDKLDDQWEVHPANSRIGSGDNPQQLQYSLLEFPIFNVSTRLVTWSYMELGATWSLSTRPVT